MNTHWPEKKEMEEDDDEGEEDPEERMETPYPRSSSVQLQNML